MFERFTDRGRLVIKAAQDEVRLLNHDYVGTEHLLLGLLGVEGGVARQALNELNVSLEDARVQVEKIAGKGDQPPGNHIPFTPRHKKVLELSLREALQLGHSYISTEHLLLALVREGEGKAAEVFRALNVDLSAIRSGVIMILQKDIRSTAQASSGAVVASARRSRDDVLADIGLHEARISQLKAELGQLPSD